MLLLPPVKECSGKVLCTIKSTVEPPCATASRKRPPTISDYLLTLTESETSRRRDLHTVNMVYKCTHSLAHEYLQDRFVNRVSNYFLRDSSHKFDVPLPRTNYLKSSVRYSGRSYGTVGLRLFGKQNPDTFLNLAARNSSNNIHSA